MKDLENHVALTAEQSREPRSSTPALFREEPAKLILNRRAIAAGLAALMGGTVTASAKTLSQLSNIPLSFDIGEFKKMTSDGVFLPDYRKPMVRVVFEDGQTTLWHRYDCLHRGTGNRAAAIEICAPDKNGMPRYSQLSIG